MTKYILLAVLLGVLSSCSEGNDCSRSGYSRCFGDAIYWVDACGERVYVIHQCECGCSPSGAGCNPGTCGIKCCTGEQVCYQDSCCTPDCAGRECGSDGCGGTCGTCTPPDGCHASGQCACTPECTGKECGDDGCRGSCGDCGQHGTCRDSGLCACDHLKCGIACCSPGEVCHDLACCAPDCDGKDCGDDGCGGSCGFCWGYGTCTDSGTCECEFLKCGGRCCGPEAVCHDDACCMPNCFGRECGPDGCGGTCAPGCGEGVRCYDSGQCAEVCGTCNPNYTRCNGDVIEACEIQQDGCTDWNAGTDCSQTGQYCDDWFEPSVCVDECPDRCPEGATRCVGDVLESCSLQDNGCLRWEVGSNCRETGDFCFSVAGTFVESGQELEEEDAFRVELGDLDGDDDLDAVTSHAVWLNDGDGFFPAKSQVIGGRGVDLGDVDGDGDLDAFVAVQGGNWVMLNDGSGLLLRNGQELGDSDSFDIELGDLDGDGDLDALVANVSGPNRMWINDGSGWFVDSAQDLGSQGTYDVDLGDVDGDGDLDAFFSGDEKLLWLNDGNGILTASDQEFGAGFGACLGDIDQDGDLDLFSTEVAGCRVWLNDGAGTFSDSGQRLGYGGMSDADIGDVDGDGDLDVLVGVFAFGCPQYNVLWLNDGAGLFSEFGQYLRESMSETPRLGDLNGDGYLDAFLPHGYESSVWLNLGGPPRCCSIDCDPSQDTRCDGTRTERCSMMVEGCPEWNADADCDDTGEFCEASQIAFAWSGQGFPEALDADAGDLDGDGDIDIVLENVVFLNAGDGYFYMQGQLPGQWNVELGDLDEDGDLDAVIGDHVLLNDGSSNFTDTGRLVGERARSELVDLDGDQDLDVILYSLPSDITQFWYNDGSGIFTDSGLSIENQHVWQVVTGDLDGDDDQDAFVCGYDSMSWVWLNDGTGVLTDSGQVLPQSCWDAALGDLDGDGDLDAFLTGGWENRIWTNDGNGVFSSSQQAPGHGLGLALADFDGDGDTDAFVSGNPNHLLINHGSLNFSTMWEGRTVSPGGAWYVKPGDLDSDRDLDVIVALEPGGMGGNGSIVWLNELAPALCVGTCGDGQITPSEDCEGDDHGGEDCVSLGFNRGDLACDAYSCQFDTFGCFH